MILVVLLQMCVPSCRFSIFFMFILVCHGGIISDTMYCSFVINHNQGKNGLGCTEQTFIFILSSHLIHILYHYCTTPWQYPAITVYS